MRWIWCNKCFNNIFDNTIFAFLKDKKLKYLFFHLFIWIGRCTFLHFFVFTIFKWIFMISILNIYSVNNFFYQNLIAILIQNQHLKVILVQMWLIWGIQDKTEIFLQFSSGKNISYENIWMNEIVSYGLIHILK